MACGIFISPQVRALEFAEARHIAEQQSPRVTAQLLQINAVESAQKAAGSLPDPKFSVGLENFPISGMDRWSLTRESMTMQRLALMQEVPNRAKLRRFCLTYRSSFAQTTLVRRHRSSRTK